MDMAGHSGNLASGTKVYDTKERLLAERSSNNSMKTLLAIEPPMLQDLYALCLE
jgi:hypothetical protein